MVASAYLATRVLLLTAHSSLLVAYVLQLLVEWRVHQQNKQYQEYLKVYAHAKDAARAMDSFPSSINIANGDFGGALAVPEAEENNKARTPARRESDRRASARLPAPRAPPRVGVIHSVFHRVGLLVCIVQVILTVDLNAVYGVYPLWLRPLLIDGITLLLADSYGWTIYAFMKLQYETALLSLPRFLGLGMAALVCTATLAIVISSIAQAAVGPESWVIGVMLLVLALVEAVSIVLFDISVYRLRQGLRRTEADAKAAMRNSLPSSPSDQTQALAASVVFTPSPAGALSVEIHEPAAPSPAARTRAPKSATKRGGFNNVIRNVVRLSVVITVLVTITIAVQFSLGIIYVFVNRTTVSYSDPDHWDSQASSDTAADVVQLILCLVQFWYAYMPCSLLWQQPYRCLLQQRGVQAGQGNGSVTSTALNRMARQHAHHARLPSPAASPPLDDPGSPPPVSAPCEVSDVSMAPLSDAIQ